MPQTDEGEAIGPTLVRRQCPPTVTIINLDDGSDYDAHVALKLPFQPPLEHMLAKLEPEIPAGALWHYEPKWDGFRALVFFDGDEVYLQSRDLKPLGRYFPELEVALKQALPGPMVLDGEIVIATDHGLDFGTLQMRIHPAESRVRMLARETPSSFVAFDMLADGAQDLRTAPFGERRKRLEAALAAVGPPVYVTPATLDPVTAKDWFERFEGAGLDGVVAKRLDEPYKPGVRSMIKIKHLRTVDCVVGGFRWNRGEEGKSVGFAPAGPVRREGQPALRRPHLQLQGEREARSGRLPGAVPDGGGGRGLRPGPDAGRPQPLDERPQHGLVSRCGRSWSAR